MLLTLKEVIIIRLKAYIPQLKQTLEIQRINFDVRTIEVDLSGDTADYHEYDFDEIIILKCSYKKDKQGNLIYEGDKIVNWENDKLYLVEYDYDTYQFIGKTLSLDSLDNGVLIPLTQLTTTENNIEILGSLYDDYMDYEKELQEMEL
jgi:hypothetical protein